MIFTISFSSSQIEVNEIIKHLISNCLTGLFFKYIHIFSTKWSLYFIIVLLLTVEEMPSDKVNMPIKLFICETKYIDITKS